MQDWDKVDNVPVTLHLTAEAARILRQYGGERNRGWFVSQLLMELRRDDDREDEKIIEETEKKDVEIAKRVHLRSRLKKQR